MENTNSKKEELKPVICRNCNKENSATARFCSQCGIAFFIKDAVKVDNEKKDAMKLLKVILGDEELKGKAERKLEQLA